MGAALERALAGHGGAAASPWPEETLSERVGDGDDLDRPSPAPAILFK
ncbi:hypothetical protein WMF37_37050 [Sorangium sp. So ce291]